LTQITKNSKQIAGRDPFSQSCELMIEMGLMKWQILYHFPHLPLKLKYFSQTSSLILW